MTWILSLDDYRKRRLPSPGLLDSLARGGGIRQEHAARVLAARRDAERFALLDADRTPGAVLHVDSAASASDPGAGCRKPRRRRIDDHVLTLATLAVTGAALGAFIVYGSDIAAWATRLPGAVKLPVGILLGLGIGWCARRIA